MSTMAVQYAYLGFNDKARTLLRALVLLLPVAGDERLCVGA